MTYLRHLWYPGELIQGQSKGYMFQARGPIAPHHPHHSEEPHFLEEGVGSAEESETTTHFSTFSVSR